MKTHDLRALVAAAKRDAPPPALERSVLGALGLGAAAVSTPSVGAKLWLALKHAAGSKTSIGLLALAAASGGAAARWHDTSVPETARPATTTLARRAPETTATATTTTATATATKTKTETPTLPTTLTATATATATLTVAATATVAVPRPPAPAALAAPTTTPTATATATAPAPASSLAAEIASIHRARASVLSADAPAALGELDAYDAAHPRGELREEALALRVRAERLAGDDDAAKRALDRLSKDFPGSVQLRALGQNAP